MVDWWSHLAYIGDHAAVGEHSLALGLDNTLLTSIIITA